MNERVAPLSESDLIRITQDGESVTFEFDAERNVTVVGERYGSKWEEHERPESAGDVIYISEDDVRHIRLSKTGIYREGIDVRLIREASTND